LLTDTLFNALSKGAVKIVALASFSRQMVAKAAWLSSLLQVMTIYIEEAMLAWSSSSGVMANVEVLDQRHLTELHSLGKKGFHITP
jgi:hypothetical protein